MTTQRWKCLLPCLILVVPAMLHAQGPRGGFFPWWDGPIASGLDLSDAQRAQIRSVIREYRGRMLEVRDAVQKAETDLDEVFNEDSVDQRRGAEAIDRLVKARADMTKSVSEMSLRMRAILTPQQWQSLRQRDARLESVGRPPGPPRGPGRSRRGSKNGPKSEAKGLPPRANNEAPPALNQ